MALILRFVFYSAIISATWNTLYSFHSAPVYVFHFLLISKAVPFFFEKNLFLRFKLEITSFYLWAHAGCTLNPSLKDVRLLSIIAAPSSIQNAINHAYMLQIEGERVQGGGGVGGSSIRPRVKAEPCPKRHSEQETFFPSFPSPPPPPKKRTLAKIPVIRYDGVIVHFCQKSSKYFVLYVIKRNRKK